jgi:hypothetical protein
VDHRRPAQEEPGTDGVTSRPEQAYIDEMVRRRGYVLDYHKYMANADYDVLVAANNLVDSVYLRPRLLDRKTKELLFILSLTVLRAEKSHIQSHIRVALEVGAQLTLPARGGSRQRGEVLHAERVVVAADAYASPGDPAPLRRRSR